MVAAVAALEPLTAANKPQENMVVAAVAPSIGQGVLLLFGLGVGAGAALLAVVPTLQQPGNGTVLQGGLFFLAVAALGAVWIALATVASVRGPTLRALRGE